MEPFLGAEFGNPSGGHATARVAKTALETSRETIAGLLGAEPGEVVFTGSGTEADNLAVKGAARAAHDAGRGDGVVVSTFEHKGVLAPAERLAREGFRVVRTPVTTEGVVDLEALAVGLDHATVLVSVMTVNNEVGTIQPLDTVAGVVSERAPHAILHTDAVQAVPWIDVASATRRASLVSVSAHKFGGPKGVGALVVRRGVPLEPMIEGGGQEQGLRSGTTNVAGVVGMAAALTAATAARATDVERIAALRSRLITGLTAAIPDVRVNGAPGRTVAGSCHLTLEGVDAETLLVMLDRAGVCAAAGSSCASGATEPSHVLLAMGRSRAEAASSIRLSLGYPSTAADVDRALAVVPHAVAHLRTAGAAA